jgi:predicted transcriptional regulator
MNKTQKLLKFILEEKPTGLIQIQNFAKAINGSKYASSQGYYTSNLNRLLESGLLERVSRGEYVVTKLGEQYINDKLSVIRKLRHSRNDQRAEKAVAILRKYIQAIQDGDIIVEDKIVINLK